MTMVTNLMHSVVESETGSATAGISLAHDVLAHEHSHQRDQAHFLDQLPM